MDKKITNISEKDVRAFYGILGHEKETEVRLLDLSNPKSSWSEFVHNEDEFVELCKEHNGKKKVCAGIHERRAGGTKTSDVVAAKTIVIDIDSVRPGKGLPATDEELAAAEDVADTIIEDCKERGLVPPIKVCSGNGYHLYFCVPELAVTDENRDVVGKVLKDFTRDLANRYSTPRADIDNIADLARIIQAPGTMNIKGDATAERPHRLSRFVTSVDPDAPRQEDVTLHGVLIQNIVHGTVGACVVTCKTSDTTLDEKALQAKLDHIMQYNTKARSLMDGDIGGYKSRSEAEQALAVILVRDGIRSKNEIDTAMRQSELGKWSDAGDSYRECTYRKAVEFAEQIDGRVTIEVKESTLKVRRAGTGAEAVIISPDGSEVQTQAPKTVLTNIKAAAKFLRQNYIVEDKDEAVREARRFINEYNVKSKEFAAKWKSLGLHWSAEEILKDGQYVPFSMAQEVMDGVMYYGICIPVRVPVDSGANKGSTVVASKTITVSGGGELLTVDELEEKGYFVRTMSRDISAPRWSEKGIRHFIATKGKEHVDTRGLYDTIKACFEEFIDLQDGRQYTLLALWTMGTYVFQAFSTYPYIYIEGYKASGKSKVLGLASCMAFNPVHSTDCSTASLFRSVHYNKTTLLLDEMEGLQPGSRWERTGGIRQILNSGYKKGAVVARTGGEDFDRMDRFEVYSPKMIASIEHPDYVLGSRCIRIIMLPVGAESKRGGTSVRSDDQRWQDIRDDLYTWGLQVAGRLVDIHSGQQGFYVKIQSVSPRMKELWMPLLHLADLVGQDVLEEMVSFCKEYDEQARIEELEEALEMKVLKAVIEQHRGTDKYYLLGEVKTNLPTDVEECIDGEFTHKRLGRMMRKLGFSRTRLVHGVTQFFISQEQIDDACRRHGVRSGELHIAKCDIDPVVAGETSTTSTSGSDECEEDE